MPGDELFKRYLEIGASMLGMSRERAETIVRDLVASGEVARGQAAKAADWLVERGRAGTEELAELVRREVREQVKVLGLATRDDLARLEGQLDELRTSAANAATPTTAAPAAPRRNAAPGTQSAAARTATSGSTKAPGATTGATTQRSGSTAKAGTAKAGTTAAAATEKAVSGTAKAAGGTQKAGRGTKKAAPPGTTMPAGGAEGRPAAGIRRSASVRRRPGGPASTPPDPGSPAGGAVPPEG